MNHRIAIERLYLIFILMNGHDRHHSILYSDRIEIKKHDQTDLNIFQMQLSIKTLKGETFQVEI